MSRVTEDAYRTLIDFTQDALGHEVEYKESLVK